MLRIVYLVIAMALLVAPSRADDEQICFSIGTTNYDKAEYWKVGLAACEHQLVARDLNNVQKSAYHKQIADWRRRMGEFDAAIIAFGTAAALNPRDHEIYDYRGDTWAAIGNNEKALEDYNTAIRIRPSYPAAYLGRAEIYKKRGDLKGAEAEYRKVLSRPAVDRIDQWAHGEARSRLESLKKSNPRNN